ncbi:hypothetical protein [Phenylobacterium sp.]|uniref:hypothetical protein n=1 Tax=Phenylobacterium sp. TaxID=1871053 RepID=UPI001224712E|nr:hypothetical protein [Phenylobacterium sp.]THD54200.1 MAG: hypothetical protein E8A12_17615 [Phenylobacterium sp.]
MVSRGALPLIAAALLASAAASSAAPPISPSTTVEGVTVEAPKPEPEKLAEKVNRFVMGHSVPGRTDHISRWAKPVCPQTFGLAPEMNTFVSARVRAVAASVGAPDQRPGAACETNVLIIFSTDPQGLMDDVRNHHSRMLGFHYFAQAKRLATVSRPIQAWYMTGTEGKHQEPELDDEFLPMPGGAAGSRLSDGLTSRFVAVLVVIDSGKVADHEIGAVADDAAMLTLMHVPPAKGCSELPTILDLLNPTCPASDDPPGLTPYDLGFLKGLYSTEPTDFLSAQRSEIGSRILREMSGSATH